MSSRFRKISILVLLATISVIGAGARVFADNPAARATPVNISENANTQSSHMAQSGKLGKINVEAMQHLVKTLQQVKVGLRTPFNDNPKLVDQMVCQLGTNQPGHRSVAVLECGTQGWYSSQREATQLGILTGQAAIPARGHPWHSVRILDHAQLMYLRKLLKVLPPPESDMQVIEDLGKTPEDAPLKHGGESL